ncbi:hypothetical protein E8E12_010549 [Didymella heteroderae]|uniref:Heterokaryon incompatibility domain-containing protein n=1 Tax=Didymella heteroderae TaxID=1769908 RepID=A0A9P4WWE2_9PLEO|nr:hypothetical protein E8E12_010549 [Didymella heteroderae]
MTNVYDNASLANRTDTHIRLIELLPGPVWCDGKEFDVSCKFHVRSLFDVPKYTAISYMWGQNNAIVDIVLDGAPFTVRPNLFELLLTLSRIKSYPGYLWVDALCIDQGSIQERNHQVALMGKIYSNAEGVIVWLGSKHGGVSEAIEHLRTTGEGWDDIFNPFGLVPEPRWHKHAKSQLFMLPASAESTPHPHLEEWYMWTPSSQVPWSSISDNNNKLADQPSLAETPFEAKRRILAGYFVDSYTSSQNLLALCTHPYWSRAWIVQELVLADNICLQCGDSRLIDIDDLTSRLEYIRSWLKPGESQNRDSTVVRRLLDSPAARLLNKRRMWQDHGGNRFINPWDTASGMLGCSDVRDRVYAMSALMDPELAITPDYNKSPSELFEYIFEQHLKRTGTFSGPIWNLQSMLELGDEEPIVQRARQFGSIEWISRGQLANATTHKTPTRPGAYGTNSQSSGAHLRPDSSFAITNFTKVVSKDDYRYAESTINYRPNQTSREYYKDVPREDDGMTTNEGLQYEHNKREIPGVKGDLSEWATLVWRLMTLGEVTGAGLMTLEARNPMNLLWYMGKTRIRSKLWMCQKAIDGLEWRQLGEERLGKLLVKAWSSGYECTKEAMKDVQTVAERTGLWGRK